MAKPKVATTSLAGCFGCHMSLLDIDDRILKLVELVDFDKSPIERHQGSSPAAARWA
jgi:NAD-reducing hydrogenase small subunit